MNEILQKRIEEVVKKTACPQCVFNDGGTCNNDDDCKLFDDFVGLMTFILQNQWISVGEALPEKIEDKNYSKYVLTRQEYYEHEYYVIARYDYGFDMWVSTNYFKPEFITHWMPIPEMKGCEK